MFRFLLRLIGLLMLAAAFFFFVYDGTKSIANQHLAYIKVGDMWAIIDQTSLNSLHNWFRLKALWAWDPYAQALLDLPTWIVLAAAGMILMLLGRKKRPLIGYARN